MPEFSEVIELAKREGFNRIIFILGVLLGLLSLGASALSMYLQRKNRREKLKAGESIFFSALLFSNDLSSLSNYLSEKLGKFTVFEYAENEDVSHRVDSVLSKLIGYVGSSDELSRTEEPVLPKNLKYTREREPVFEDIERVLEEGETWNALAQLRHYIEISLRQFALNWDPKPLDISSAGRLIIFLDNRNLISPNSANFLRYAIAVANRGIHGHELRYDVARKAISSAEIGLDLLLHPKE